MQPLLRMYILKGLLQPDTYLKPCSAYMRKL